MDLSPDQVRAARAAGCTFLPATDDQVARLTMQRRIFRIDGVAHLAQRADSGFYETHGTLTPLLGAAVGEPAPVPAETLQEAEAADASATLALAAESRGGRGAQVIRRGRPRGPRGG
ncbi:hypothetical protein [Falsiroseomonas selenitidurans]|uniref:Uncharacterized protein n=1 Tax=Falsiroseomonas selenitidurans TaxID=2716335 RepID=A0ABX1DYM4_9PROT|nr:hypothetical protein [Falsiroseomonas selenitidurans]NKC29981.1 hypothetical protein [Falsiroseomonas selenitidurans]